MTKAGRPDQPNASERFHEERATYTMQGSQPDIAAGIAAIREVQANTHWLYRAASAADVLLNDVSDAAAF